MVQEILSNTPPDKRKKMTTTNHRMHLPEKCPTTSFAPRQTKGMIPTTTLTECICGFLPFLFAFIRTQKRYFYCCCSLTPYNASPDYAVPWEEI